MGVNFNTKDPSKRGGTLPPAGGRKRQIEGMRAGKRHRCNNRVDPELLPKEQRAIWS